MGARGGSLQQAQAMASVLRGKLAGEISAVMVAAQQGDRAGILIDTLVEQQVVATQLS